MALVRQQPHVTLATGVLVQQIGIGQSIQGIDLDEFNAMSGGSTTSKAARFRDPTT